MMLMGEDFFDGHVHCGIIKQVNSFIQEMIYVPWKIAGLMDKHGSKLLMEALDLFCTLETDGQKKLLLNTILCSSGLIKHVRKFVDNFARTRIPYHLGVDALPPEHGQGEVIWFDTKTVVMLSVGGALDSSKW
jgi:hypothetical protein